MCTVCLTDKNTDKQTQASQKSVLLECFIKPNLASYYGSQGWLRQRSGLNDTSYTYVQNCKSQYIYQKWKILKFTVSTTLFCWRSFEERMQFKSIKLSKYYKFSPATHVNLNFQSFYYYYYWRIYLQSCQLLLYFVRGCSDLHENS